MNTPNKKLATLEEIATQKLDVFSQAWVSFRSTILTALSPILKGLTSLFNSFLSASEGMKMFGAVTTTILVLAGLFFAKFGLAALGLKIFGTSAVSASVGVQSLGAAGKGIIDQYQNRNC